MNGWMDIINDINDSRHTKINLSQTNNFKYLFNDTVCKEESCVKPEKGTTYREYKKMYHTTCRTYIPSIILHTIGTFPEKGRV